MAKSGWKFAFLVAATILASRLHAWQAPQAALPFNPIPSMEDPLLGRTTPRQMLETFYFSLEGLDYRPDLIQSAAQCLDNSTFQAEPALLHLAAVHLGEILDHFDLPHNILPEATSARETVLFAEGDFRLALRHAPGDGWRFSAETVKSIPDMRREVFRLRREATMGKASPNLMEGRRNPEMTLKAFRDAIARRDFVEAATCLDNSGFSPRIWVTKGPELARQLAFVFQRAGFLFGAEVPNDPAGSRYTWHASPRGRIALERVPVSDTREAWLFNRATLESLPAMVEQARGQPADPRWVRLGLDLGADVLRDMAKARGGKPPAGSTIPEGRETPRALLMTLFRHCEELKSGRKVRDGLAACLDLGPLSNRLGREISPVRVAITLEAVLRSMDLEIGLVSDLWNDEPQTLKGGGQGAEAILRRMEDGGWKFDYDTLLRLPEMYARLSAAQKTARDRYHDFATPRETYATFEWSLLKGDMERATECLDLSEFPSAARAGLGPRLAWKIRYFLDRNKLVIPQEVPNQPDGRRWGVFRAEDGEALFIARRAADPWKDRWLFTADSLERIEDMFPDSIGKAPVPEVAKSYWFREGPDFLECPSVWLHIRMPDLLRTRIGILEGYQVFGIILILTGSYAAGWLATLAIRLFTEVLLARTGVTVPAGMVFHRLRPIRLLVAFGFILGGLDMLDLPIAFQKAFLPASKALAIFLCLWAVYRLADLGLDIHLNRPQGDEKAGLHDLLAPTVTSLVKIFFILVAGYFAIDLMGDADLLTRILAGLGIVGLAVSLAAQDAIKHFFGTLLLISERPFRIGDRIIIDKHRGMVETVGFRSTRIRTSKGTLVILPNSALAGGTVENLGRRERHFERLSLPLENEAPPERRELFMAGVRDACRDLAPWSRKLADVRWIQSSGDEVAQVVVEAWLPGWGGKAARDSRQLLLERIALLASVHRIEFADQVLPTLPGDTLPLPIPPRRSA